MRSAASGVLPASLSSRWSARFWLSLAAAVGCAACAYAGLYPRFDDGNLRIVLALTSAPFAAAVTATALGARTPARAFGAAVLLAAIMGIASVILPALIMSREHSGDFFVSAFFGGFFGAPTGALYGIPIAILVTVGHPHVLAGTHESTDRASVAGGIWLFFVALIAFATTSTFDGPKMDWATSTLTPASCLPAIVASLSVGASVVATVRGLSRLRRRTAWIGRVRSGLEPAFRLRPVELRDRLDGLPRIGVPYSSVPESADPVTVLEWLPEAVAAAAPPDAAAYRTPCADTAYRTNAAGTAVAVVTAAP